MSCGRCFASGAYRASPDNFWDLQAPIAANTDRFLEHFVEVYPPKEE